MKGSDYNVIEEDGTLTLYWDDEQGRLCRSDVTDLFPKLRERAYQDAISYHTDEYGNPSPHFEGSADDFFFSPSDVDWTNVIISNFELVEE